MSGTNIDDLQVIRFSSPVESALFQQQLMDHLEQSKELQQGGQRYTRARDVAARGDA